jgi:hypothetical protein
MKKIFLIFLSVTGLLSFISYQQPPGKMDGFKWLIGTWKMQTDKGIIMETWLPVDDSSFSGESTLYKPTTEVVTLERVNLVCRENSYYYIPVAAGQNENKPVSFRLTAITKTGFTAENPEHDFPKRINYHLIKKDSLHAYIDGGPSMKEKRSDYYFLRVKTKAAPKK